MNIGSAGDDAISPVDKPRVKLVKNAGLPVAEWATDAALLCQDVLAASPQKGSGWPVRLLHFAIRLRRQHHNTLLSDRSDVFRCRPSHAHRLLEYSVYRLRRLSL